MMEQAEDHVVFLQLDHRQRLHDLTDTLRRAVVLQYSRDLFAEVLTEPREQRCRPWRLGHPRDAERVEIDLGPQIASSDSTLAHIPRSQHRRLADDGLRSLGVGERVALAAG